MSDKKVDINDDSQTEVENTLEFQICDWNTYHEIDDEDEENYIIQLFGRTEDDKDVCLKVVNYTPFFYVEIPLTWNETHVEKFVEALQNKVAWRTSNNPTYDYDLSKSLVSYKLIKKHKYYNFTNKKYFKFVWLVFKSHTAMKEFASVLAKPLKINGLSREPTLYQRYESNIEPHIRFMHINNLSSCGWVSIDKSKLYHVPKYSSCDHSYIVKYNDVKPAKNDDRMAPFKIMGYDIECISCDHNFPQSDRESDQIIQIGMTMYRYGSMNCYEQHLLTLKQSISIKGANVECYRTEKGLLRGWAKKMAIIRPDFKIGYNNFGFDDPYIFDRIMRIDKEEAKKQGISVESLENKFIDEFIQTIGKVNNKYLVETEGIDRTIRSANPRPKPGQYFGPSLTYFENKNLSSSALGDNELKFFQVPGIISVDMMKVIQRDHRLIGYKLDNVSANFITECTKKIVEVDEITDDKIAVSIYTASTKALEKESYIQIMVNDGYSSTPLSEGAKYKVLDIETVTEKIFNEKDKKEDTFTFQAIKTVIGKKDITDLKEIFKNSLLKVYWTFAKDDMHHTLLNKYFKEGEPKRIRQIGKYCLKDCKLVNLLMAKLEIIVNSVGMAKVCHVPLSYLFLRGQGVKIFSLVSKKCREKGYLIPVLRIKKKDNTGDDDETYEGATVITPRPAVYLSPIGVLDFSSLYPNSMRERNLSHECYINDAKYDNLEGYIYHDVFIIRKDKKGRIIRNIDGTPQKDYHRFAQEIITDEQMNEELKDILTMIDISLKKNIENIKQQKYHTDDSRKEKINFLKSILEKNIDEINENNELSEKSKNKKIALKKDKINKEIEILTKQENNIKEEKNRLDEFIKEINSNTKLSEEEKKNKIIKENKNTVKQIKKLVETIELTDRDREELINVEHEKAKKKISDEKSKKYNVVIRDGKKYCVKYGILAEILTELLNKRKETNGRLAREKDPFLKAILNALQLAFKVTANSLYGQTGAPTSPIFFIAIAASTTAIGRERLHFAKKTVEDNFPGSEVIYGDSVTGDTPLLVKNNNNEINITTISNLGNYWNSYEQFKPEISNRQEKQQAICDYEIWTANGWSKIKRVIRHKTIKKIYRVLTNTGCIDVTEDHSLLGPNRELINPAMCKLGTELLHDFPEISIQDNTILHNSATILGYSKYLYAHDANNILNSSFVNRETFLESYLSGKIKYMGEYCAMVFNDKIEAQFIYYLLRSLGYHVIIDTTKEQHHKLCWRIDKNTIQGHTFRYGENENSTWCECETVEDDHVVKKIDFLKYTDKNEFVYDLETEDGTFHAGIGELIVKNTDSIFINFHIKNENDEEKTDTDALIKTIELCQQAAKIINDNVPKPQSIVYEKTFHPFILVAKKKYVGLLYEKDPKKYFLKSMGIVLKRRDNAPIVKILVGGIIDHILKNRDINKAIWYAREVLQKLMDGKYPIDKFIISKTLKAKYKKPMTIAHKVLADRMAIRDPGNKPQINDRIPFVYVVRDFVNKKKKDILQGDLIEHPDYVIKNGLKIDYLYYLEHQIITPASQILELMMPKRKVENFFNEFIIIEDNKRKGRQSMEKWMDYSKREGSKTSKKQDEKSSDKQMSFQKSEKKDTKLEGLVFKGNTKRHECQDMGKWMDHSKIKEFKTVIKTVVSINKQKLPVDNQKCQAMDKWLNNEKDDDDDGIEVDMDD